MVGCPERDTDKKRCLTTHNASLDKAKMSKNTVNKKSAATKSVSQFAEMTFRTNPTLVASMTNFTSLVERAIKEDTEEANTDVARVFRRLSPELLPDEYRNLTDAWSAVRLDTSNEAAYGSAIERFLSVSSGIMYRAAKGRYMDSAVSAL